LNVQDPIEKWTPLQICCMNGYVECVIYLIEKGADTELLSDEGLKAIDYAELFKN
jgi:ankyrin repeat protein